MHISIQPIWFFVGLGLFWAVFMFWSEARRDGFDSDKTFDIVAVLALVIYGASRAFSYWYARTAVYNYASSFLKVDQRLLAATFLSLLCLAVLYLFSKLFKWSFFRLLDIFAVSVSYLAIFSFIGLYLSSRNAQYLILVAILIADYVFVLRKRGRSDLPSGVVFSLTAFLTGILLILFARFSGYLLFSLIFLTISGGVLVLRKKKSMSKDNLTTNFLNFVKDKLKLRDKELRDQEKLIKQEDPYLQAGRSEGNAEEMDEAILEDSAKEVSDSRMNIAKGIRHQVKRALSFMKMGKYGICEICGKPIDKARLAAFPEATKCLDCASKSGE
jgi:RNA polymerase-binding transcription factor DksA